MPSDVPHERLQDIITNIDRVRAHLEGAGAILAVDGLLALSKQREAIKHDLRLLVVGSGA